ncbi:hypothetical protein GW17_00040504 [Ensete ventricosum]|nr:hypothetical protein GW17_00040504 [Ensete ventricosum]
MWPRPSAGAAAYSAAPVGAATCSVAPTRSGDCLWAQRAWASLWTRWSREARPPAYKGCRSQGLPPTASMGSARPRPVCRGAAPMEMPPTGAEPARGAVAQGGYQRARLSSPAEIVYPCIPDPDGEDEGGQVSSSLAVSTRWISAMKLLQSDLATLAHREGRE